MSTRFLQKFTSLQSIGHLPSHAGIGVVGGIAYLNADGSPVPLGGAPLTLGGSVRVVDPNAIGAGTANSGIYATLQAAIDDAVAGDVLLIAPGDYDEALTISRTGADGVTLKTLTLIGVGARGAVAVAPSTAAAVALTNHADDVTLVNVGLSSPTGATTTFLNTGARLRCYGCKIEGSATAGAAFTATLGTVAQIAAGTRGKGADVLMRDCEFCWTFNGVLITCTDFGAVTQLFFDGCRFHNYTNAAFEESTGSGGSAAIRYRNLQITDCVFDDVEGGAPPTKYLSLNDNNGNDGIVSGCRFPTAINSGLNLVSTALTWVGNFHTGGISAAQPS